MTTPDPEEVESVHALLFGSALRGEDLDAWYRALTARLAIAEAALEMARLQRAQVVAHLHDTMRQTYTQIAERLGGLDRSRAAQLAAKGRPHITPGRPPGSG